MRRHPALLSTPAPAPAPAGAACGPSRPCLGRDRRMRSRLRLRHGALLVGSLLAAVASAADPAGAGATQGQALTQAQVDAQLVLPTTDDHYKATHSYIEDVPIPAYHHASAAAIDAFRDLKYGVRIHWGIYSILGKPGESWPYLTMSPARKQAYDQLYRTWNPKHFDAEAWMQLFQDSGLKMFAFTTKHHEGFSMFDTASRVRRRVNWLAPGGPAVEDCDLAYSIMETPYHRDVVKELCDAGHRHGLAIDLYYSNPDWYDADFRPYVHDPITIPGPLPERDRTRARTPDESIVLPPPTPAERARMMARYRQQLTELLSNYGKIDMICLDMWLGKEVWPEVRDTMLALRALQPDVMLRARGIGNYGDYYTPEHVIPGDKSATAMPWFVIYPLAKSFSYDGVAADYKGGAWIVRTLVDTVAKGGGLMIGIGPDGDGAFSPTAIDNLHVAGDWLRVNGSGIYATRPRPGDLWKEGTSIRFTTSKDGAVVYAFALTWPGPALTLHSVHPRPGSAITLMGYPKALAWTYDDAQGLVIRMPSELDTPDERQRLLVCGFRIVPAP
jgi:alpha-L-fucosidase